MALFWPRFTNQTRIMRHMCLGRHVCKPKAFYIQSFIVQCLAITVVVWVHLFRNVSKCSQINAAICCNGDTVSHFSAVAAANSLPEKCNFHWPNLYVYSALENLCDLSHRIFRWKISWSASKTLVCMTKEKKQRMHRPFYERTKLKTCHNINLSLHPKTGCESE